MNRVVVGIILHGVLMLVLMYATTLSNLASFIIAGIVVWLGILVFTEDMFG